MAVQQQLGDYNHHKCQLPHKRKTMGQLNPHSGPFPKVRTGWPDHGHAAHFDKEIRFFQEFLFLWRTI